MKLKIVVVILALIAGALMYWWEGRTLPVATAQNDFAAVTVTSIAGKEETLAVLGKDKEHTLLHFWATWCAPCVEELPALVDFAAARPELTLVAVSIDSDVTVIQPFLQRLDIMGANNIFWAHDPAQAMTYDIFQVSQFPETLILNKDLQLQHKLIGAQDWAEVQL